MKREAIAHLGTLDFIIVRGNCHGPRPSRALRRRASRSSSDPGPQAGRRTLFATAAEWVARLADAHHANRLQDELVNSPRSRY